MAPARRRDQRTLTALAVTARPSESASKIAETVIAIAI
jgi:hypothetical protein